MTKCVTLLGVGIFDWIRGTPAGGLDAVDLGVASPFADSHLLAGVTWAHLTGKDAPTTPLTRTQAMAI